MKRILFVDDEPNLTAALARSMRRESFEVFCAKSADEALEILAHESMDVVISDDLMPGMRGSELLSIVSKQYPDTVRIILTGHADVQSAIQAINEGEIYRFLTKPCHEADLILTIRQGLERNELLATSRRLQKENQSQAALLNRLEKQHPGITQLKKSETGALIIDQGLN